MTEHAIHPDDSSQFKRKQRHEGPKNHVLAFALSIMLTAFSFLAVAYAIAGDVHLERWFVLGFIVMLGLVQAVIQLAFWMHMKDKGHEFPILFIVGGFIIALTVIASGLFFSWW